jgi:hypothetical protein
MTCFICEETLTRSMGYVHGACSECVKNILDKIDPPLTESQREALRAQRIGR